jgi:nicotinate-nucleotide pyrophosphorylase (carboxylating)
MSFSERERAECLRLIQWGLDEDLGRPRRDLTSATTIPAEMQGKAVIVVRQSGVIAGLEALSYLADELSFDVELLTEDGTAEEGKAAARLSGRLQAILAGERLALNLLGHMSGVASITARYVAAVAGTKAKVCDTRKTTPGWRYLDKYAVRVGGGTNHRIGLFDGVLIKDNHLAGLAEAEARPIAAAVGRARSAAPAGTVVEVEIDSLTQLDEALASAPDIILLDNMTPENLGLAVEIRDSIAPRVQLEASGGINLQTIAAVARAGVDRISVGALTHSATVLDLALDYESSA